MDTGSKGAIIGMTTATTVAEIYRGYMEGIAYEMLLNMEYLRDTGVRFKKLQASGGGAASSLWMQMKGAEYTDDRAPHGGLRYGGQRHDNRGGYRLLREPAGGRRANGERKRDLLPGPAAARAVHGNL